MCETSSFSEFSKGVFLWGRQLGKGATAPVENSTAFWNLPWRSEKCAGA